MLLDRSFVRVDEKNACVKNYLWNTSLSLINEKGKILKTFFLGIILTTKQMKHRTQPESIKATASTYINEQFHRTKLPYRSYRYKFRNAATTLYLLRLFGIFRSLLKTVSKDLFSRVPFIAPHPSPKWRVMQTKIANNDTSKTRDFLLWSTSHKVSLNSSDFQQVLIISMHF